MNYLLALAAVVFLTLPYNAHAKPVYTASEQNVSLTLHTEDCAFKDTVAMPLKATWTENGVTVEGCWIPRPDLKVVLFYFPADKSVFAVGMERFKRMVDA
jgi:hypothetical protein